MTMKRGVLALVGLCSGLLAGETSTACGRGPVAPNNVVCEGTNRVVRAALASVPEVVYVTRAAFAADHHNTATIFQCGEINERSYRTQGALKAWNPATGATRVIVPEKAGRTIRDPEVDWDGKRILFSMRDGRTDDYHIYVETRPEQASHADQHCSDGASSLQCNLYPPSSGRMAQPS